MGNYRLCDNAVDLMAPPLKPREWQDVPITAGMLKQIISEGQALCSPRLYTLIEELARGKLDGKSQT